MSPPPSTAASFSTLRERSALHLLVMGAVCLIAVAYDFAESLFGTWIESQSFVAPTLVAFAVFLGGAILIKKVAKTPGVVNAIAIAAMIAGAKCLASISKLTPPEMRPELTLVLIFAIILMSRAAIVPERPRITLILGGLFYLPLLHITYDIHKDFTLPSPLTSPSAPEIVVYVGFLWTVILFTALASSQAIYGLRRRASKAEQLGQYTLEERLGGGGMGHVYRAQHALLQRPTAVKLIRFNDAVEREALISRFEQEVNNSAQLTHPNTITVYDYGRTDEGVFYYAMELLEGASLEEVVTIGGAMPVPRVLNTMRQSAAALSEAHALGLIHRDIKPGNIMLAKIGGRHDFVKVLDFGLVKDVAKTQDVSITQAGALVGTPHYMAPEASSGEELQATADVYALGAVAY
ncbi:MAG: serine/threonine-protein kinase, partial [Myxococcota bacterium]